MASPASGQAVSFVSARALSVFKAGARSHGNGNSSAQMISQHLTQLANRRLIVGENDGLMVLSAPTAAEPTRWTRRRASALLSYAKDLGLQSTDRAKRRSEWRGGKLKRLSRKGTLGPVSRQAPSLWFSINHLSFPPPHSLCLSARQFNDAR